MQKQLTTPVALIFFNRPKQFAKVFETVKKAQPSKLFLIQDGARDNNEKDIENIQKCREVLKGIDWECEINEDFSEVNLGCGKRVYTGISKCFEQTDRLIILEDDCVPSQSFFPFCDELLEKYKNDERVGMITGMNHLGEFNEADTDYFFANVGSIAGWATWKRNWDSASYDLCDIVNDSVAMRLLKQYEQFAPNRNNVYQSIIKKHEAMRNGQKMSSWSTQIGVMGTLNSRLVIVPRVNLMSNIGLTAESANSVSDIKLVPKGLRPLYQLKLFELEFPLKHPKYVFNDIEYCHKVDRLMRPNKFISKYRKAESIFLRIIHGDFKNLAKKLKKKVLKK